MPAFLIYGNHSYIGSETIKLAINNALDVVSYSGTAARIKALADVLKPDFSAFVLDAKKSPEVAIKEIPLWIIVQDRNGIPTDPW